VKIFGLERLKRRSDATGSDGSSVSLNGVFTIPASYINGKVHFTYTVDSEGSTEVPAIWDFVGLSEGDITVNYELMVNVRFSRTNIKTIEVNDMPDFYFNLASPANWATPAIDVQQKARNLVVSALSNTIVQKIKDALQSTNK
jgi:hypothetical protein